MGLIWISAKFTRGIALFRFEQCKTRKQLTKPGNDLMADAFEVYNEKGCGFLEDVCHECLERELTTRRIAWVSKIR
jgi:hypothetical protein